jgi:hypothetical protein
MSDEFLGHAVDPETREVRFFSVSSLEKADPRSQGCYRRWWYRYPGGERELEADLHAEAKAKGVALHAEAAHYLRTGEKNVSPLLLKGMHMMPTPGSDLRLEYKFHKIVDGKIESKLTADGIPVIGFIDCLHERGINYGCENIDEASDPPGTIEVIDWKRKGTATTRNGTPTALTADALIDTIQMSGYGELVRRSAPLVQRVRLSHGYFFEKGSAPRKVTKLHVVDDFVNAWKYTEALGRNVREIAREESPDRVPGNVNACDAYGGCPQRGKCTAYHKTSLDGLWSKVAEEIKETEMGLLTNVPGYTPPPTAPAQSLQQPNTPEPTPNDPYAFAPPQMPVPAVPPPDYRTQLAQEEQQMRAQQQQIQQQHMPLREVWQRIQAHGRGTPTLFGPAAQALAMSCGQQIAPGAEYQGTGTMTNVRLSEPNHLYMFLADLERAQPSPNALPSAQVPIEVIAPPGVNIAPLNPPQRPVGAPPVQSGGLLAPEAPASNPLYSSAAVAAGVHLAPDAGVALQTGALVEPPKKRGRPKKDVSDTAPAPQVASTAEVPPPPASVAIPPAQTAPGAVSTSPARLEVFVDCRPEYPTVSLAGYVDHLNAELAKRYCVDAQGRPTTQDIRVAPKDSPLAFGGWKGALHEIARTSPPRAQAYHLDTRGNEMAEVVADALRVACGNAGLYVRGVR